MVKAKLLKQIRKKVEKADRVGNPLESLSSDAAAAASPLLLCWTDDGNGTAYSIEYRSSADIPPSLIKTCLDLFEENMGELYRQSSFGLDLSAKEEELKHRKARFLLVYATSSQSLQDNTKELVAFVHFRFCYDDDDGPSCAVLYVYEMQVVQHHSALSSSSSSSHVRRGIGTRLMSLVEEIARSDAVNLDKVMLTVLKNNTVAMSFYKERMNFQVDNTCPSKHGEVADYEILSKAV